MQFFCEHYLVLVVVVVVVYLSFFFFFKRFPLSIAYFNCEVLSPMRIRITNTLCLFFLSFQIYMFAEWYKPGCCLEYPLHGSAAVVDALVRGLQKFGGRLSLRSHVDKVVVENGRATGVKLRSGQVSNVDSTLTDHFFLF